MKSLEVRLIHQKEKNEEEIELDFKNHDYYQKIKFNKLNYLMQDPEVNTILSKFIKARVDIKNSGSNENSIIIEESEGNIVTEETKWWQGTDGKGLVVKSIAGHIKLKVRCINNGLFKLFLRTMDMRDDKGKRIPIYVKYTELNVNGEDILDTPQFIHHDAPFEYQRNVNDSDILDISIKWNPV